MYTETTEATTIIAKLNTTTKKSNCKSKTHISNTACSNCVLTGNNISNCIGIQLVFSSAYIISHMVAKIMTDMTTNGDINDMVDETWLLLEKWSTFVVFRCQMGYEILRCSYVAYFCSCCCFFFAITVCSTEIFPWESGYYWTFDDDTPLWIHFWLKSIVIDYRKGKLYFFALATP